MNPSGHGHRLETGWAMKVAGDRVSRSPLMDGEAAEVQPPARTRVGPQRAGARDLRHPRREAEAAEGGRRLESEWAGNRWGA